MNKALDVAGFIDRRGVGGLQILVLALCLIVMIIDGFDAQAVGFVAPLISTELRIADLLADGPKTADTLAFETSAHAASLRRLLRALASIGLVEEIEPGRFSLTATGAQLRSNVPGSMRNLALMFGGERAWRSWGELLHSVRTGESATRHVFGVGSFEYLAANPDQAVIFNEAMAELTRQVTHSGTDLEL